MKTPLAPPRRHSPKAWQWRVHAPDDRVHLPVCADCGQVCYPLREICPNCLSSRLEWRMVDNVGEVLAECTLMHSNASYFRDKLPMRIGTVKLACGPVAFAFLLSEVDVGQTVRVALRLDDGGDVVLVASRLDGPVPASPAWNSVGPS
ncbi:MAG: Zn-ribbon domain-containing OB-fold protein [Pigmentiphaga sp.]